MIGLVNSFFAASTLLALSISAQPPDISTPSPASSPPAADSSLAALKIAVAQREPLARYIPIEASFYFRMSDDHKWHSLLGTDLQPASPLAGQIQNILKGQPRIIALPTWRNRKEMITLCKPEDPQRFTELLQISTVTPVREEGKVRIYHLPASLWMATDGHVFVFSDIGTGSAIFEQSARMLGGAVKKSLLDDRRFLDYMAQVDLQASGVLFVDESWARRQGQDDPYQRYRPRWLPDLQSGCVEIHLQEDQIRCRLRSSRRESRPPLAQAIDPQQLKLLPTETIAAWAMPLDLISFVELAGRYLPSSEPSFYRQLARTMDTAMRHNIAPLSQIGPRCTMCLLSRGKQGGVIQMAWMIEAKHAEESVAMLAQICQGLAKFISAQQAIPGQDISFKSVKYRDHTLYELTHNQVQSSDEPQWLLGDLRPTFCAVGNQLVLASDPGVIRKILDAQRRKSYATPLLETWAAHSNRQDDDTQIRAFMNPRQIALELAPLRSELKAGDSGLLQDEWFQSLRDYFNDTPVQLGARLRKDNASTPGKVEVMHVLEGRPSEGKLRPGDFIVGIDGEVLSLADPTEDLRNKLQAKPAGGMRRLRIERDARISEVEIFLPRASNKSFRGLLDDTGRAIDYLASLGNRVDTITYKRFGLSPDSLDAQIILKLKSPSPGE